MAEIGYQTGRLASWAGLARQANESNPDLIWPKSIEVYDRMRREDAQVASVLRAVTQPIRSTTWSLDPAGARDEVVEFLAQNLGLPIVGQDPTPAPRLRGRFSWDEHLRHALLCLPFGHSYFEQVYEPDGNRLRLRKLAWRPPRTIADIEVAQDGGLVAIVQHGTAGTSSKVRIPVDRLVAYVHEREGGNWLGQSLLRAGYKNWLLKDRLLRIQALVAERNGLGLPIYTAAPPPANATYDQIVEWIDKELERGLTIAKDARAGDGAGASIPNGANLRFAGVEGDLPDTDKPIRYHDEQLARTVLAHFLNLGTETGSWALGSTFANFFTDSLNGTQNAIADTATQHVVEDIVDLNWGEDEPAPRIVAAPIGAEHPVTEAGIKSLIDAGAITVDDNLEAHLRSLYGLPVKVGDGGVLGLDDTATDAERARFAAETAQKVYLAVGPVMSQAEARDIVRRAGGDLDEGTPPEITQEAA